MLSGSLSLVLGVSAFIGFLLDTDALRLAVRTTRAGAKFFAALLLGVALMPVVYAWGSPLGSMSEEELKVTEPTLDPKPGMTTVPWARLLQRQPHMAYFDDFADRYRDLQEKLAAQAKAAAQPPGADKAETAPPSAGERGLSGVSDTAFGGMVVANSMGGMTPGTTAHGVSNVLLGVSVAFDILSWLSKDRSDDQFRYQAIKSLNAPSLWLLKIDPAITTDEAMHDEIAADTKFIASLDIACEPAWFHAQVGATIGYAVRSQRRARRFACGFAPGESLGFFGNVREPRELMVLRFPERPTLVLFDFKHLDDLEKMPTILGLDKTDMANAARVLYTKIAPKLGPEWTIVFTAPGSDGRQHAYGARNGILIEYPVVPNR